MLSSLQKLCLNRCKKKPLNFWACEFDLFLLLRHQDAGAALAVPTWHHGGCETPHPALGTALGGWTEMFEHKENVVEGKLGFLGVGDPRPHA